jgi:hypothetical protein
MNDTLFKLSCISNNISNIRIVLKKFSVQN